MNIGRRSQLRSLDGKLALVARLTHSGFVTHISINDLHWFRQWLGTWHQGISYISYDLLSSGPLGTNFCEIWTKIQTFQSRSYIWKYRLQNDGHSVHVSVCQPLRGSRIHADITIWHWIGWSRVFYYRSPSTDPSHWNCTLIPRVRYNINKSVVNFVCP